MPLHTGANQVRRVFAGADEVCRIYRGLDARPFFQRSGIWKGVALDQSAGTITNTAAEKAIEWGSHIAGYPLQPQFPPAWVQSPVANTLYRVPWFKMGYDPRNNQVELRVVVAPQPAQVNLPSPPLTAGNKRLATAVEGALWSVTSGNEVIDFTGPDAAASQTRDSGDGVYVWRPAAAGEARLRTLIDALVAGTNTGTVVLEIPNPADLGATISNFGASRGRGNRALLTMNLDDDILPTGPDGFLVTISGTLANASGWRIDRVDQHGVKTTPIQSAAAATEARWVERLSLFDRPDSRGWVYNLTAHDASTGLCGDAHATCRVRVIQRPTITSFTATTPVLLPGPQGTQQQASFLSGVVDDGDPTAVWALSQTGRDTGVLPGVSRSLLAQTGIHRPRVQVSSGGGRETTVTLTGTNEAGSVSRNVTISWLS